MNKFIFSFLSLFLISCGRPKLDDCPANFALKNFQLVNYVECDKDALISDFEDYIDYTQKLLMTGEAYRERIASSVPENLKHAKRVFCSDFCSATHYIEGQCLLWESSRRKLIQDIDWHAKKESAKNPACERRWDHLKVTGLTIDYNWRNTWRYKNRNKEEFKRLGNRVWNEKKDLKP